MLPHRQFDVVLLASGARNLHAPRLINDGVDDEEFGALSGQNILKRFTLLLPVFPPQRPV